MCQLIANQPQLRECRQTSNLVPDVSSVPRYTISGHSNGRDSFGAWGASGLARTSFGRTLIWLSASVRFRRLGMAKISCGKIGRLNELKSSFPVFIPASNCFLALSCNDTSRFRAQQCTAGLLQGFQRPSTPLPRPAHAFDCTPLATRALISHETTRSTNSHCAGSILPSFLPFTQSHSCPHKRLARETGGQLRSGTCSSPLKRCVTPCLDGGIYVRSCVLAVHSTRQFPPPGLILLVALKPQSRTPPPPNLAPKTFKAAHFTAIATCRTHTLDSSTPCPANRNH